VDAFQKIDKALKKEPMDEAIPALARFLAAAGAFSGVSQRVFLAYVTEVIEEAYNEMERRKQ
jgi:hypothetical protein